SPTSLVSGSYFQINNGLSTETHHCASAHRINLSGNPYNNNFHIASLYTQCAKVSLARTSAGTANDYTSQIPIALRDTIAKTLSGQASQPEKKLEIFVGSKSVQLMPDTSPLTPEQIRPYALIGKNTYDCDLIYKAAQVRVEGYGLYKSWNDSNPRPVIAVYACTKAQHG
ncbi:MAG: hypothetical protein K2Q32_03335, partial [Alphaproteobacteria bacterium]|nr:hypothetical protein [Alphaproteobacteria bacterium]